MHRGPSWSSGPAARPAPAEGQRPPRRHVTAPPARRPRTQYRRSPARGAERPPTYRPSRRPDRATSGRPSPARASGAPTAFPFRPTTRRRDPPPSSSTCTVPVPLRSRRAPTATSPVPRRPAACSWSRRTRTPGSGNSARPDPTPRSSTTSSTTSRPATASTFARVHLIGMSLGRLEGGDHRLHLGRALRLDRTGGGRGRAGSCPPIPVVAFHGTADRHRGVWRRRRERRCRGDAEQGRYARDTHQHRQLGAAAKAATPSP